MVDDRMIPVSKLVMQLNITDAEDEAFLAQKIEAAESWVASYVGKSLTDLDPVPPSVVEAVLQLAAHLYENREATLVGVSAAAVPFGVTDLLAAHREWSF